MLKRGAKSSYNPYSTSQRVKKAESKGKDRLDILPNKHNVWLKQVCLVHVRHLMWASPTANTLSCKIFAIFVAVRRALWLCQV